MPLYDLIPAVMLGVGLVTAIAALIGKHRIGAAGLWAMAGLFFLSFWFTEPVTDETRHLHWFPASLAVVLLMMPLITVTAAIGGVARLVLGKVRSRRSHRKKSE